MEIKQKIILIFAIMNSFNLSVDWVKPNKEIAKEGEIVEIKAKISNLGISQPFTVYFYYDFFDEMHLIGKKRYESINLYRYPSIKWDTKGMVGKHEIIVYVDGQNVKNNFASCNITILPSKTKANLLIKEFYYYSYPNKNNEYICIFNAGNEKINIRGWYITTQPWKRADEQNKVIFPDIEINPNESIYITQNGSSFREEKGFDADYEYYNRSSLPDLKKEGKFILPNKGGVICLKDKYNHTIDVVVYGNASFNEGWIGEAIKSVKCGEVLIRKNKIDTNSSNDWKIAVIGQSNFQAWHGIANKAIAFCSPDCSYEVISKEIKNASNLLINIYLFTNPFLADIINKNNISIKLLLDGNVYGGIPMEERYIAYMLSKKGEVKYMMGKRYKYNHAKYIVIDGKKCIIESANWAKSGIPIDNTYGNREWGILIDNENVSNFLIKVFEYDWMFEDCIKFNEKSFTHGKPPEDFKISYFIPKNDYIPKFSPLTVNFTFNLTIILSPDNAESEILKLIDSAKKEILVEQSYIQKDWSDGINPFLEKIIEKNESGVRVYFILDKRYTLNKETFEFLSKKGIKTKLHGYYTIHNKGVIIDEKVMISSINWGENSVRRNREIGIIIENEKIANYYRDIFWYDWNYKVKRERNVDYIDFFSILIFITTFSVIYLLRRKK